MGSSLMLLDLVALACGVYSLYTWVKLLIVGHLFPNGLLVPKDRKVEDCADEEGYIAYIRMPLGVLALSTMGYGVFQILNTYLAKPLLDGWLSLLPLLAVMGVLVWYAIVSGRANRDYFGY